MRKSLIIVICALSVLLFAACNNVEFSISFIVDGESYHTITTNGNETITMPDNPTKDGHIFGGWYWDNDSWQRPFTANSLLDAPLSDNLSVYAKWLSTISFDSNGGSLVDLIS